MRWSAKLRLPHLRPGFGRRLLRAINWRVGGITRCFHVTSWEIDPRDGGEWKYVTFDSSGKFVKPGITECIIRGKIVEFVPPRRLVMTWEANFHAVPWKRTLVVWELIPAGSGTHVKVTHSGLKALAVDRKDYAGGWPGVLERFKKFLET